MDGPTTVPPTPEERDPHLAPLEEAPADAQTSGQPPSVARRVGLTTVLVCLSSTLLVGLVAKQPCASGEWSDGRQYRQLCYSDIVPLLATEQLDTGNRLPYLDPCQETIHNCDEYPVLSMYTMRVAAWLTPAEPLPDGGAARPLAGFFRANALLLSIAAFATAVALYLMVGRRALYFVLAPTLLIYAFVNWDLIAVAFATLATLAYVNRRDVASGVLLGLGAAAKLYPGLLVIPFALGRFRERRRVGAVHLVWATAGTWLVLNAPFAIAGRSGWWEFFRFNSQRPADWDSLWFVACERIPGFNLCDHSTVLNVASLLFFVASCLIVFRLKQARMPDFPAWTFAFPMLVLFLLTNKVYSPQYGLWLLPWFAIVMPDLKRFVAFEIADVAVFVTRFAFFGEQDPLIGGWVDAMTIGWFQIALVARAVVLVWCVAAWVGREPEPLPTRRVELPGEALADAPG